MALIVVTPANEDFSFNVKYCTERISIPGFVCKIDNPEEMIVPLKDFGCDDRQISSILFMIHNSKEGEVDENGEIKKFEDEYGDYDNDYDDDDEDDEEDDEDEEDEEDEDTFYMI